MGLILLIIIVGIPIYFIPTIIAFSRGHAYRWIIFALNLFLPGFGWIIGLIWALFPKEKTLADPLIGNTTGIGTRNAGDVIGEVKYGITRGYEDERSGPGALSKMRRETENGLALNADADDVNVAQQLKLLSQLRAEGRITGDEFTGLMNSVVTGKETKKAVHAIQQLAELSLLVSNNGLSEEEFRQTKMVLLREISILPLGSEALGKERQTPTLKYAAACIVVMALAIAGIMYRQGIETFVGSILAAAGPSTAPKSYAENGGEKPSTGGIAHPSPTTAALKATTLSELVKPEILGMNLDYLEQKVGKPKYINGGSRTYDVGGCEMNVIFDKDPSVQAFDLPISSVCNFNINPFLGESGARDSDSLTMGNAVDILGDKPRWNCIHDCGNVEPTTFYIIGGGGRPTNYADIAISNEADFRNQELSNWADANSDVCDPSYRDHLLQIISKQHAARIEIGWKVREGILNENFQGCKEQ